MGFILPPLMKNQQGQIRRVGFEFEYAGLDLAGSVAVVRELFGGRHVEENAFVRRLKGGKYGDFTIEIDTIILKQKEYERYLGQLGIDISNSAIRPTIEDLLARVAGTVVPHEIVTPPIPLSDLDVLDELREALHACQAVGTRGSIFYAFGLHINPEIPALDAGMLLSFLRAFLLLYEWLVSESDIDLARRISPFIQPFPPPYSRLVLDPGYTPDLHRLTDDYLRSNPTRNRPLDLLPLLAHLDPEWVLPRAAERELIKPRPAFHYRLPNCLVDDSGWRVADEWNRWVEVERLAADPERIHKMSAVFLAAPEPSWLDKVKEWLR